MTHSTPSLAADVNTDREIYRSPFGSMYDDSIHVTQGGGIGFNVGGHVIVRPLRDWHALATALTAPDTAAASPWLPIDSAPLHMRIRVWAWGFERHAKWCDDEYCQKPKPYWRIEDLGPTLSRKHQPKWWMPCAEMPAPATEG